MVLVPLRYVQLGVFGTQCGGRSLPRNDVYQIMMSTQNTNTDEKLLTSDAISNDLHLQ